MKTGIVTQFNEERGIGVIYVPSEIGERYFFYGTRIIAGPQPKAGDQAMFSVSPRAPRPGQLPYAEKITIMPKPTVGLEVLSDEKGGKVGA
jgi:hypothetical protein